MSTIVSITIITKDRKILLTRDRTGVYAGFWHNIGGSLNSNEDILEKAIFIVKKYINIDFSKNLIQKIKYSTKDEKNGTTFIYFNLNIKDKLCDEITMNGLIKEKEIRWFDIDTDLNKIELSFLAKRLFNKLGLMPN